MRRITCTGDIEPIRPEFHAEIYASMRVMEAAFGVPDLIASSMWIVRVETPGGDRDKQFIVCPHLTKCGFDPRIQRCRTATWVLVSASNETGEPDGAVAPVIAAIRCLVPAPRSDLANVGPYAGPASTI